MGERDVDQGSPLHRRLDAARCALGRSSTLARFESKKERAPAASEVAGYVRLLFRGTLLGPCT
jgi:hypothetical protein